MSGSYLSRSKNSVQSFIIQPARRHYSSFGLLKEKNIRLLAIAGLIDVMSISWIVPLLPVYGREFGISALMLGIIFGAESITSAIFSVPAGYVSDRIDRVWLITAGMIISGVSVLIFGFMKEPLALVGLRALDGVGSAFRGPATNAYLGDEFQQDRRGRAMGAVQSFGMLGVALGPLFGGLLGAVEGVTLPFTVLGVTTILWGILLFVALDRPEKASSSDTESTRSDEGTNWFNFSFESIKDATSVPIVALGASVFIAELGAGAYIPYVALLIETRLGVGPAFVGVVYAVFGFTLAVMMPIGGSIGDVIGRKRSLLFGKMCWVIVAVGLAVGTTRWVPLVMVFLGGIATGFSSPAEGALKYEIAPQDSEGTLIGAYSTLNSIGRAIGPLIGGLIVAQYNVTLLFVGLGVLWLLDFCNVLLGVREPDPK